MVFIILLRPLCFLGLLRFSRVLEAVGIVSALGIVTVSSSPGTIMFFKFL